MIDKMLDILDSIGWIKLLLIESAYIWLIFKVGDMGEKAFENGLKALGICLIILILSVILYAIFSMFGFQTGMNFLAYIALLTVFLIGVPLMLLFFELAG